MGIFLCVDGGGTKCRAMLLGDDFTVLGQGISGGVNTSSMPLATSRAHVNECLDAVFAAGVPERIDRVYVIFIGPLEVLQEALAQRTHVQAYTLLGEGEAGALAGALSREGIVAVAGTGSDIFHVQPNVRPDAPPAREGDAVTVIGGLGGYLGDFGGGVWIGQAALQAAVQAYEGWGEKTVLPGLLMKEWSLHTLEDLVNKIHSAPAPMREMASAVPIAAMAANAGDAVSQDIFRQAGKLMAKQTACLIDRARIPPERQHVVCCGGAWKAYQGMYHAFEAWMRASHPEAKVAKPLFEHVAAGAVAEALGRGMPQAEIIAVLNEKLPECRITW